VGAQITEIQALIDAAQEVLGRDVVFHTERIEQAQLSSRQLPHVPMLAECVILPAAWDGSYFFNRIGREVSVD